MNHLNPLISVITASLNAEATIEDTLVRSVTSGLNPLKPDELNQRVAGSAKAV